MRKAWGPWQILERVSKFKAKSELRECDGHCHNLWGRVLFQPPASDVYQVSRLRSLARCGASTMARGKVARAVMAVAAVAQVTPTTSPSRP